MSETQNKRFDVFGADKETGEERLIAAGKIEDVAHAIIKFAVLMNGVEKEFFYMKEVNDE